ncbi:hypothetical protein Pmar_PMAR017189 [Perkinsus marinus ATCC 50983]|uniref:C3H1-type domain-containing protein n=1 Tax=Perkinsus marinus (strain ATCC 50983 / TXsc) TaxID=423536 RepID=C5LST9_PERM5|nr:hypothetical protein Pmar_PMAR017189 [Perkinsus marinus ATCC 50983]EER00330.1 hypothetical protein Pmar_PMAR017189 [Perkinsus marinus ATCC 50983]|eukprot:XP_002767612.1 hypothetical protein Pmar_PMAR017189 [Perkinsus marinus ATCC 50983]
MATEFSTQLAPSAFFNGNDELSIAGDSLLKTTYSSLSSAAVPKEHYYKTKLCVFHTLQGRCVHGVNCTYAHGVDDLVSLSGLLDSPPSPRGYYGNPKSLPGSLGGPFPPILRSAGKRNKHRYDAHGTLRSADALGRGRRMSRRRTRPRLSAGRPWTTLRSPPAEDLLSGVRTSIGEESLLSHSSLYSTNDNKFDNGNYINYLPSEENTWTVDDAEFCRNEDAASQLFGEALHLLDDNSAEYDSCASRNMHYCHSFQPYH